jgi:hypothetical protein
MTTNSVTFKCSQIAAVPVLLTGNGDPFPKRKTFETFNTGSFVHTCLEACAGRHKLKIRPEHIWAAIISQFTLHYRKKRKCTGTLTVQVPKKIDSREVERMIVQRLREKYLDVENMSWMLQEFSMTTAKELTALTFVSVGTWEDTSYHESKDDEDEEPYGDLSGLCEVILEGTVADWKLLRTKIDEILKHDDEKGMLKRWHAMLAGVLEKFIESSEGSPDISWWNQMCQEEAASADLEASYLTGWLAVFNVFDSNGGWIFPMCGALYPQIEFSRLLKGVMSTNVNIVKQKGIFSKTRTWTLHAGLQWASVSEDRKVLTPKLTWKASKSKARLSIASVCGGIFPMKR